MCGNDFESTSVALSVILATWYKPDSRNGLTADVVQVPIHTQRELGTGSGSPLIPRLPNLCSAS